MTKSPWITALVILLATAPAAFSPCYAFEPNGSTSIFSTRSNWRRRYAESPSASASESTPTPGRVGEDVALSSTTPNPAKRQNKCGYFFDGRWEQRKNLADLKVGDELLGRKLDGSDLLEGKTGPKIFFECGVGRVDTKGNWHMVNGMLRLGKRGARKSATKKRVARMTDKVIQLFVSCVDTSGGRLEVTTSLEKAEEATVNEKNKKTPASSLKAGDQLIGTIVEVKNYGVFVDVGANRLGLLHIQKVADLFDRYIERAEGLVDVGLERGAQIKVAVSSNEKKRLFLDFTPDVKDEAEAERGDQRRRRDDAADSETTATKREKEENARARDSAQEDDDNYSDISADEAAAWAAYGAGDDDAEVDDWAAFAAGNDNTYDEDDDIEDALGIGSYR